MFFTNKKGKAQEMFEYLCKEKDNYILRFGENGDKAFLNNFEEFMKSMANTYQELKNLVWDTETTRLTYKGQSYLTGEAMGYIWSSFIVKLMEHYENRYKNIRR